MKNAVFFRSGFNYDCDAVSNETALSNFEPTLTVQSEAENCDINVILERFGQGISPPVTTLPPYEGEWTQTLSFTDAMNLVAHARESFMELSANIRARFHNNPQEMLDFIYDDSNYDEAIKLGLVPARVSTEDQDPQEKPEEQPKGAS